MRRGRYRPIQVRLDRGCRRAGNRHDDALHAEHERGRIGRDRPPCPYRRRTAPTSGRVYWIQSQITNGSARTVIGWIFACSPNSTCGPDRDRRRWYGVRDRGAGERDGVIARFKRSAIVIGFSRSRVAVERDEDVIARFKRSAIVGFPDLGVAVETRAPGSSAARPRLSSRGQPP